MEPGHVGSELCSRGAARPDRSGRRGRGGTSGECAGEGILLLRDDPVHRRSSHLVLRALPLLDVSPQSWRRLRHLVRGSLQPVRSGLGQGRSGPVRLLRSRNPLVLWAVRQLALLREHPAPRSHRHRAREHGRARSITLLRSTCTSTIACRGSPPTTVFPGWGAPPERSRSSPTTPDATGRPGRSIGSRQGPDPERCQPRTSSKLGTPASGRSGAPPHAERRPGRTSSAKYCICASTSAPVKPPFSNQLWNMKSS